MQFVATAAPVTLDLGSGRIERRGKTLGLTADVRSVLVHNRSDIDPDGCFRDETSLVLARGETGEANEFVDLGIWRTRAEALAFAGMAADFLGVEVIEGIRQNDGQVIRPGAASKPKAGAAELS